MNSPVKIWRNQKHIRELLNKKGEIVSWTKINIPPAGFETVAPYMVVLVKLDTGKTITAQFVSCGEADPAIGQKVVTTLRRTTEAGPEGVIPYGVKVKPIR